ncbi:hypothetical protein GCM10011491_03990 [Brucella endophytica]|uniref:DUF1453 domain-containing protein n=1 Tax=Brucella endophytica TaxID=1963359 RepID=A0A916S2K3_9HYPH|nr:DUF6622 family protein [Brucella endophytica]GGA79914.1 hypothetical protein GCM10011491_03990 [Brucella endophytica]
MSAASIIAHTPVWVWVLMVFLLYRGIIALQPREMTWQRMLLLPVLFFAWALYDVARELHHPALALAAFACGLVIGGAIGWLLAARQEPAWLDPASRLIHRPGTPVTLIAIIIGFLCKYALSVAVAHHADLAASADYNVLYGGIAGMVDGVFWGMTGLQLCQVCGRKPAHSN